jgi:hypothetical protein
VRFKVMHQLLGLGLLLLVVACTAPRERSAPGPEAAATPAATPSPAPDPSPLAAIPIPDAPGALGSVVANGKTVDIRHVYAGRAEDPFHPEKTLAVLLLSDRPLEPASFDAGVWQNYGQSLEFRGIGLRVADDGTVRNLLIKHDDIPYQTSGSRMDEFEWVGAVVKGRNDDHGHFGNGRIPWSYALAFNTTLPRASAKKKKP